MTQIIEDLKKAKQTLQDSKFTFVLLKEGKIARTSYKRGVIPFMMIIRENRQVLNNAIIADKVIGKAAALLAAAYNVRAIYAEVISSKAREVLDSCSINYQFGESVDYIKNRNKDRQCPIEKLTSELKDPYLAYQQILKFYKEVLKIDV